jgi:hypothetical protein
MHRRHMGTHTRRAGRETVLRRGAPPLASVSLAAELLGR